MHCRVGSVVTTWLTKSCATYPSVQLYCYPGTRLQFRILNRIVTACRLILHYHTVEQSSAESLLGYQDHTCLSAVMTSYWFMLLAFPLFLHLFLSFTSWHICSISSLTGESQVTIQNFKYSLYHMYTACIIKLKHHKLTSQRRTRTVLALALSLYSIDIFVMRIGSVCKCLGASLQVLTCLMSFFWIFSCKN